MKTMKHIPECFYALSMERGVNAGVISWVRGRTGAQDPGPRLHQWGSLSRPSSDDQLTLVQMAQRAECCPGGGTPPSRSTH